MNNAVRSKNSWQSLSVWKRERKDELGIDKRKKESKKESVKLFTLIIDYSVENVENLYLIFKNIIIHFSQTLERFDQESIQS